MKKIFASFLTVLTLLGTTPVFALNEESNTQIVERFEDGSYIEVTIEEIPTLTRSNTKKGNKTTYYKNTYDVILWSVKTSGTFTYDGSTAKCTASSVDTQCPAINWKLSNIRSSKSGASAYGYATAKQFPAFPFPPDTDEEPISSTLPAYQPTTQSIREGTTPKDCRYFCNCFLPSVKY